MKLFESGQTEPCLGSLATLPKAFGLGLAERMKEVWLGRSLFRTSSASFSRKRFVDVQLPRRALDQGLRWRGLGVALPHESNGGAIECSIERPFTLPDDHPGELGDPDPGDHHGRQPAHSPNMLLPGRAVWRRCMRSTLLITRSAWPTSPRQRSLRSPGWGGSGPQLVGAAADLAARNWFMGDKQGQGEERGSTQIRFSDYRNHLRGVSRHEIQIAPEEKPWC
jgi:hypothetical protein